MRRLSYKGALLISATLISQAVADLTNGSFSDGSDGLSNWSIVDPFLLADSDVAVMGGDRVAALGEGDGVTPAGILEQTFLLSNAPLRLSFDFDFEAVAGGPEDPLRFFDDFMNVALFKTGAGDLFTDSFGFGTPVFLTFDRHGVLDDLGGGSLGAGMVLSNRYELDLSGLGLMAGDELMVSFLMVPSDDGFVSNGLIDNVNVTAIPAPAAVMLALLGFAPAAWWRKRQAS